MDGIAIWLGLVGLVVMILFAILGYLGPYAILYIIGAIMAAGVIAGIVRRK
jgi:hypothetical protein